MKTLNPLLNVIPMLYRAPPAVVAVGLFFFVGFADGVMLPFFALWAQKQAAIPTQYIGLLLGCYAGGELLATPLLGGIADRIGRRPVLLLSTAGVGIGFIALHFMHGVVSIAATLVAIGAFESVLHPTIATVIADTVDDEPMRRYFAWVSTASSAGRVAGPAVGALLALHAIGYVFVASGLSLMTATLIVALLLPETRPAVVKGDDDDEDESLGGLFRALRDQRLARMLAWLVLLEISASWIEVVLPLYAHGNGVLSVSGVGRLFTYAAALTVALQFLVTRLSASVSGFWLVLASGIVLVLAFVALWLQPTVITLTVAMTLTAIAHMLFGPLVPAAVNQLAPAHSRATYMAAISVTHDLQDTLGPATGTALYAAAARLPWFVGLPTALLGAAGLACAIKRHSTEISPTSTQSK
jgi:predicted MFS family arabinose efflux permease